MFIPKQAATYLRTVCWSLFYLALSCSLICCKSSTSSAPGGCEPKDEYVIDPIVPLVGQEENEWCWAASGQMVFAHYDQQITQCRQVEERYPNKPCCSRSGRPEDCGKLTGWPRFCGHGLNVTLRHGGLSWDEIRQQIWCGKSPVAFTWRWNGGPTGHMMVAVGYGADSKKDSDRYLMVNNPLPRGQGQYEKIFYSEYLPTVAIKSDHPQQFQEHEHWDDFYDFHKDAQAACSVANSE